MKMTIINIIVYILLVYIGIWSSHKVIAIEKLESDIEYLKNANRRLKRDSDLKEREWEIIGRQREMLIEENKKLRKELDNWNII